MKSLKNILLFRVTLIFCLNVYFKNVFIFGLSIIFMFLVDKKESIILSLLLLISLINIKIPVIGYVSAIKGDIAIVNSVEVVNQAYHCGDFIVGDKVYENTPYSKSLKRLSLFDDDVANLFKKVIFNEYVSDNDLIFNVGYGFALYFILRAIFDKNKYLAIILLFIYSLFFDFEIKLLFIIIDFILSFFDLDCINDLSIKIIIITLIDISLLKNYTILLTLIFSFVYKSKYYKSRFLIGGLQSLFFGQVNIFTSLFYGLYIKLLLMIFVISLVCFICPLLLPIYLFLMKVISFILKLFLISVRGKVSLVTMLILFVLYLFGLKKDYQLYALLLILLLSINNPFRHITFIDVGHGDAILLSNYDYKVLIDTGSSYNYHKLKKTLFSQGVYTIDYLLISHNDEDHCGNVDNLKKDFKIKNIVYDKKDIEYKDLYLNCLDAGSFDNENDNSLVYYLNVDGFSFLFTGDISKSVERVLLNKYDLKKIGCLKVAHHGSNTSTSSYFIANLLPDYAIISTNGKYNHPHVDTITTLRKYLVNILSTKEEGDISFYLLGFIKFVTCKSKIIYLN